MTRISILAVLAIALAVPTLTLAQSSTTQPPSQANPSMTQPDQNNQSAQPEASEPAQSQTGQAAGSGVNGMNSQVGQTLTGTISADGKTLTSSDKTYTISNPNSVRSYANQPITVEYEMDTNNSIRITKIMLARQQQ